MLALLPLGATTGGIGLIVYLRSRSERTESPTADEMPEPFPTTEADSSSSFRPTFPLENHPGVLAWTFDPASQRYLEVVSHPDARFGYQPEEWSAPGFRQALVHTADRAKYAALQPSEELSASVRTFRIQAADGEVQWVLESIASPSKSGTEPLAGLLVALETAPEGVRQAELDREHMQQSRRHHEHLLLQLSRDIRTPLNAISGFSELLLADGDLRADQVESVRSIQTSSEHLLKLLAGVSALFRLEAGRVTYALAPVALTSCLDALEEETHRRAAARNLRFRLERDRNLPAIIETDGARVREITETLLDHALRHSTGDQVRLRVHREQAIDDPHQKTLKQHLVLAVEDSQTGLTDAELQSLFAPFGSALEGESGIQLCVSRGYARGLGGDLTATLTPGHGCTFELRIPIRVLEEAPRPSGSETSGPQSCASAPTPTDLLGEGRRVLIVDDAATNRLLLRQVLRPFGFKIFEATNGAEAIEAFEAHAPEIILMDVRMPVMDGFEATRRIRELPGGASPIIVIITAHAQDAAPVEGKSDGFMRKPFRKDKLVEELTRAERSRGDG